MAILRGGLKIFGQDIRIGLPRDRSLDNVNADERLGRKPGGNPETTINRFIAQVNQGEGLARPSRYLVVIQPPATTKTIEKAVGPGGRYKDFYSAAEGGINELESNELKRNVGMMCQNITMPSRDIATAENRQYGPGRLMPYAYKFSGSIEASFYGDKFLRQRSFFENWQKKIMDIDTHHMDYYDNYTGTMDIFQLGSFDAEQDRDRVTYAVRLYEVYPQTIGSYDYSYGATNTQVNIPITLNFRTWKNLTLDQVNGATVGQPMGDVPTVKAGKDFGLFGGILNRLPPEIRRAGRDVLQATKRNLPIGRVTGGRVFPPFL
jgi:hypothetical protein|tara:strand:+ start:31 stop:990 length:960 start_codon:yes stop_codon:yes gene_type:complete